MTFIHFFHRFMTHVLSAATMFLVCALLFEYLVPGSVLPYVDVLNGALMMIPIVACVLLTAETGEARDR